MGKNYFSWKRGQGSQIFMFQVQGDRLLDDGDVPDEGGDVAGVGGRGVGRLRPAVVAAPLRHEPQRADAAARRRAHGRRRLARLLRRGVGRVQEGPPRLLPLHFHRSGISPDRPFQSSTKVPLQTHGKFAERVSLLTFE